MVDICASGNRLVGLLRVGLPFIGQPVCGIIPCLTYVHRTAGLWDYSVSDFCVSDNGLWDYSVSDLRVTDNRFLELPSIGHQCVGQRVCWMTRGRTTGQLDYSVSDICGRAS